SRKFFAAASTFLPVSTSQLGKENPISTPPPAFFSICDSASTTRQQREKLTASPNEVPVSSRSVVQNDPPKGSLMSTPFSPRMLLSSFAASTPNRRVPPVQ